ncbi:MAG: transcriptional repressor [Deltaproteobacteria bacterium]|nr:MAG: transcriptional repressor [Deltaproteobacteria bacterium]
MCKQCDYVDLLETSGLGHTPNRLSVLQVIGNSPHPLSAQEIIEHSSRVQNVNRVTVYRILDLLVEKKLVERISAGDRSFRYGLAPNTNHRPHSHFYCLECGEMECLSPDCINLDMESLERSFLGLIERVEVRFDGICEDCRRH